MVGEQLIPLLTQESPVLGDTREHGNPSDN